MASLTTTAPVAVVDGCADHVIADGSQSVVIRRTSMPEFDVLHVDE